MLVRAFFDLARYTRGISQVHARYMPLGKDSGKFLGLRVKKGPKNPISIGRGTRQGVPVRFALTPMPAGKPYPRKLPRPAA